MEFATLALAVIRPAMNAIGKSLGGAVGAWLTHRPVNAEEQISVELIKDIGSEKVHAALALMSLRLPEYQRFPSDDIVRWLREDQLRRQNGAEGPRHYFLLASTKDRPCGCTLIHSFHQNHLAFIAYLASDERVPWVSPRLFREFKKLLDSDKHLSECRGFLLEVEDPRGAPDDEHSKRLARVRLFSSLAEQHGYCLRGIDIGYRQPPLEMPNGTQVSHGAPLLLMYASKKRTRQVLSRNKVESILRFIYHDLYPEGYSPFSDQNAAYRDFLKPICNGLVSKLPDEIRVTVHGDFGIRARTGSAAGVDCVERRVWCGARRIWIRWNRG